MALDKQKSFLFKQIEIITMVLTKLYFLTDALDYFGHDIGLKDEDTDDDALIIVDSVTIKPKPIMKEGNRIWEAYKFNDIYTLPKIKQLSDYRYTDINEYKKETQL